MRSLQALLSSRLYLLSGEVIYVAVAAGCLSIVVIAGLSIRMKMYKGDHEDEHPQLTNMRNVTKSARAWNLSLQISRYAKTKRLNMLPWLYIFGCKNLAVFVIPCVISQYL